MGSFKTLAKIKMNKLELTLQIIKIAIMLAALGLALAYVFYLI